MRNIDRRLDRLARIYGCPVHGEALVCQDCDAPAPMPAWLKAGVDRIMDGVIGRLTPSEIRQAMARSPSSLSSPCPRCGRLKTCLACSKAVLRSLLTPDERTALRSLVRDARQR
jgi:hypothetical protein